MSSEIAPFLKMLVPSVPELAVLVAGFAFALGLGRRAPRASGLAVAGCALLLVLTVIKPLGWYFMATHRDGNYVAMMAIISIAESVLHAVAIGLLVAAVFADRRTTAAAEPMAPPPPPPPYGYPR
jgi:hypothetical protein